MRACPDCQRLISPAAVVCPHCLSRVGDASSRTSTDTGRHKTAHEHRNRSCARDGDILPDSRTPDSQARDGQVIDGQVIDSHTHDGHDISSQPGTHSPLSDVETRCIARFGAGAEAGYFADALSRTLDIETQIVVREHREAVHGVWSTDFALLVRAEDAPRALQTMRDMLLADSQNDADDDGGYLGNWTAADDEDADHELALDLVPHNSRSTSARHSASRHSAENFRDTTSDDSPRDDASSSTVPWVPFLITLAAGTFVYWTVEQPPQLVRRPPVPVREPDDQLWDTMTQSPEPWTQRQPQGPGIRELRFDLERGTAILREDFDGDGTIDRERSVSLER